MAVTYDSGVFDITDEDVVTLADFPTDLERDLTNNIGWFNGDNSGFAIDNNGTLTIDHSVHYLKIDSDTRTLATIDTHRDATFNIGSEGTEEYGGTAIAFTRSWGGNSSSIGNIRVEQGGVWNWYSGTIISNRQILIASGAELNTYSPHCILKSADTRDVILISYSNSLDIEGLTTVGYRIRLRGTPAALKDWKVIRGVEHVLEIESGAANNTFHIVENVDLTEIGTAKFLGYRSGKWAGVLNYAEGSPISNQGSLPTSSANTGLMVVKHELRVTCKQGKDPLEGIKMYIKDDNTAPHQLNANAVKNNVSYNKVHEYTGTSDAVGEINLTGWDDAIITEIHWRDTGGLKGENNHINSRAPAHDDLAIFEVAFCGFKYKLYQEHIKLRGLGGATETANFIDDPELTETNKAVVDAYTVLDTNAKLYDRLKSYLYDNFDGEKEEYINNKGVSIGHDIYLVNNYDTKRTYEVGDIIWRSRALYTCTIGNSPGRYDASNWSKLADGIVYVGDTGTIYAYTGDKFTGNLDVGSANTVYFEGVEVNGHIIDSNGDSWITVKGVTRWEAYLRRQFRNASLNRDAAGSGGEVYRFNFASGTTYYFWIYIGTDGIKREITPSAKGETILDATTAQLLEALANLGGEGDDSEAA